MKYYLILTFLVISVFTKAQSRINLNDTSARTIVVEKIDTTNLRYDLDSLGKKIFYKDSLGKKYYLYEGLQSEFVGGGASWKSFLTRNLKVRPLYNLVTNNDFKDGIFRQTAIVSFTVCTDGSLCDFEVVNKVHPYVKDEALRVMKLSPNWKPAIVNNKNVKSKFRQPITFVISQD